MAGRTPRTRKNDADSATTEATEAATTEETPEMTDDTATTADAAEDTASDDTANDGVENPDATSNDGSADDSSNDGGESDTTPPADEPKKFDLPADPEQLKFDDNFATIFGQRILITFADIKKVDELLKAQESGDTEAAVVEYASSDDASENVKGILSEYNALREQLTKALSQLTAIVKTEKGEIQLTPDEINAKREERKKLVTVAKQGLAAFASYTENNGADEDVKLFAETLQGMIGRAPKASSGGSGYTQSTEQRPRLGGKRGGYIKVGENTFTSFSLAQRDLVKQSKNKDITVGQMHDAWTSAAGVTVDNWQSIAKGTTTTFEMAGIPVTVHTEYDKNDVGS